MEDALRRAFSGPDLDNVRRGYLVFANGAPHTLWEPGDEPMAEGEAVIRPDFSALESLFRSLQGTPEDQERRMREVREKRAAIRSDTPEETDIVAGIGRNMGWSPEYMRHLAQPYCECYAHDDGWEYCAHATDLGLNR